MQHALMSFLYEMSENYFTFGVTRSCGNHSMPPPPQKKEEKKKEKLQCLPPDQPTFLDVFPASKLCRGF